jgi:hypothetical protein
MLPIDTPDLPVHGADDRGTQAPRSPTLRKRSGSPVERAIWHALLFAAALSPPACSSKESAGAPPGATGATGAAPDAAAARIDKLVERFTPLAKTVTSDLSDAQFIEGQKLLAELSKAGPEVGRAALARLRAPTDGKPRPQAVERALLTVAARAAPEDSKVLLENLVTQYGTDLALRTEATLLFAEVQPLRAKEILEPFVRRARQSQTLPPQEFLVRAWVTACEQSKTDPVPALADAATNLFMEEPARVRAVKELGHHKGNLLAEKALRAILVESTGDGYLRRMAAQALIELLPRETACSLLTEVADKEADSNMLIFLSDALDKYCKH